MNIPAGYIAVAVIREPHNDNIDRLLTKRQAFRLGFALLCRVVGIPKRGLYL